MAAQVGDRYSCSHCGCEMEVTKPSSSANQALGTGTEGDLSSSTTRTSDLGRTTGSVGEQSPGDYAAQGATGEGTFGTAGTTHSASARGRYGSDAPHSSESHSQESSAARSSSREREHQQASQSAPSCFCGQRMQPSLNRSSAARAR